MSDEPNPAPVSHALSAMDIPHRVFVHPGPVRSLEQAAQERGQAPEQVVRSIVFRAAADSRGESQTRPYVMVLMAGPAQISWPALRRHLGQSRVTMATADEVRASTGYELGAVAPFGLPAPMRVLVDESVFARDEISIGSGVRGTTVILKTEDLRRALGDVEVGRFANTA
jgi:Cys-tRNA(Pro) deacylase